MKTAILTDSGSAMTIQQAQEHGIFLLPLQVIDEEHSYQDGVDISTEELYEALRKQHTQMCIRDRYGGMRCYGNRSYREY